MPVGVVAGEVRIAGIGIAKVHHGGRGIERDPERDVLDLQLPGGPAGMGDAHRFDHERALLDRPGGVLISQRNRAHPPGALAVCLRALEVPVPSGWRRSRIDANYHQEVAGP